MKFKCSKYDENKRMREHNAYVERMREPYAKGALFATAWEPPIHDPTARVEMALKAAEAMSAGVRGPFHIVTT